MSRQSITNILTAVEKTQSRMSLEEIRQAGRSATALQTLQTGTQNQISFLLDRIEGQLAEHNLTAANLAIRSRRAYQWLRFLNHPDQLSIHLDALQRLVLYLPQKRRNSWNQIQISFYHQGALYQLKKQKNSLVLKIQESFISAPDRVLTAFLKLTQRHPPRQARQVVKEYTFSSDYQLIRQELEYLGVPRGSFANGQVHHLADSFSRVNQTYFKGRLPRPRLIWNNRLTYRKFGHYQWDTDTVMVSSSLDQPGVPELVLDFVMYHELLHKKLGYQQANLNRMTHTPEFRAEEQKYLQYDKARRLLNRISRKQARS